MESRTKSLLQQWPDRHAELVQLLSWMSPDCNEVALPCFLVYGKESTGKSAIVRSTVKQLQLPHAYINCSAAQQPRAIYSSILSQLIGRKRKLDEGYSSGSVCESAADFAVQLCALTKPTAPPKFIVLDNAHLLARTPFLPSLLSACDAATSANGGSRRVAAILISRYSWGSGEFMHLARHLPALHLPPYTTPQLEGLLVRWKPAEAEQHLYTAFVQAEVLGAFRKLTSSCRDLQALAEHLWPKYIEPLQLERFNRLSGRQLHQALHQALLPHVKKLIGSYEPASGCVQLLDSEAGRQVLDFELPYMAKWLLLAAYIASRNKPGTDKRVFGSARGKATGKKGRRGGGLAHQRQADAAADAVLKGPHAFPLQRMMAIYRCLLQSHFGSSSITSTAAEGEPVGARGGGEEDGVTLLSPGVEGGSSQSRKVMRAASCADVSTHVTSLVALKLLSMVSDDVLQAPRYRCNAPEHLVNLVATNVEMELSHFLCIGQ